MNIIAYLIATLTVSFLASLAVDCWKDNRYVKNKMKVCCIANRTVTVMAWVPGLNLIIVAVFLICGTIDYFLKYI